MAGDPLTEAREARDRRAWREAYDLFREADEREPLDPEALEELAEAAYWTGEFEASISIRERAYALCVERAIAAAPRGRRSSSSRRTSNAWRRRWREDGWRARSDCWPTSPSRRSTATSSFAGR